MRGRRGWLAIGCLAFLLLVRVGPVWAEDDQKAAKDTKDPVARETEVREALKRAPDDPDLLFKLGNALYDQGRRTEAKDTFLKLLDKNPTYVKALVNLGVVLNEDGQSEEALKYFDKAEGMSPNDVTVLCNKGQALYALRRYQEAIDYYKKAEGVEPKNALPRYLMGVAFADAGIYREAIREWREVVALDPTSDAANTAAENIKVLQGLLPPGDQE